MNKWADYGISAVQYNKEHTHITMARVHPDNEDRIGVSSDVTRQAIIDAIKNETTYVTIIQNAEGKWSKGQPVYIIKVNGTEFIKTVDNGKECDNLENLPEF